MRRRRFDWNAEAAWYMDAAPKTVPSPFEVIARAQPYSPRRGLLGTWPRESVYFHLLDGKLWYIGRSLDTARRLLSHWSERFFDRVAFAIPPANLDHFQKHVWITFTEVLFIELLDPPENKKHIGYDNELCPIMALVERARRRELWA